MSGKRFSIMQMMLVMLVFCVVAAAIGQLVSGRSEVSPLIFMLMLMCSPVLLMVIVSIVRAFSKR
jgi:hypothetical protein